MRHLLFVQLFLLLSMGIAPESQGQSAMPVGGGVPAAGVGAIGGGGGAAVGGYTNGIDLSKTYMPTQAGALTPTQGALMMPGGQMGGGSAIGNALQMCGAMLSSGGQQWAQMAREMDQAAWDGLQGKYDYPTQNHRAWESLGSSFNKALNGKCEQKFISKDGKKIGPWGQALYGYLKGRDVFTKKVPLDIGKYCPKFLGNPPFSDEARLRFYVYMLMVMADPESSCNPTAVGRGPNGAAIGLYQLEKPACDRAGVFVENSQKLLDPKVNMECAVAVLAKELESRNTITVGHSKGYGGTYWAPLRDDIERRLNSSNSMARADTKASRRAQHLLKGFAECHTGEIKENNVPNQ